MELVGDRIVLREYTSADWPSVASYQADPRYLSFCAPETASAEHSRALVDLFASWAREEPRRNFQLAMVERASGQLIGSCGLRMADLPAGVAEFGLELSPDSWGRGLGTEASRALLDFGFRAMALTEVRAVSVSENTRISALLRKLGFTGAGTRPGEAWMDDRGWTFTDWVLTRNAP